MRHWTVGGALVESPEGLLLVQNRRRNGKLDWSTPGGVIDEGETMLEGLTREVEEETGLRVSEWVGPVYEVHAEAVGLGWNLRVEAHLAKTYEGELRLDDHCGHHLGEAPTWVREPLTAWICERWEDTRSFNYRIDGTAIGAIDVVRL
jgi:8-oxo-dGTP diphosphatase